MGFMASLACQYRAVRNCVMPSIAYPPDRCACVVRRDQYADALWFFFGWFTTKPNQEAHALRSALTSSRMGGYIAMVNSNLLFYYIVNGRRRVLLQASQSSVAMLARGRQTGLRTSWIACIGLSMCACMHCHTQSHRQETPSFSLSPKTRHRSKHFAVVTFTFGV